MRIIRLRGAVRRSALFVCSGCLVSCSGGDRQVAGPDPGGNGGEGLPTLTVTVRLDPADSELATALGWTDGVAGAAVHLNRSGGPATFDVRTADAAGMATFGGLPPGRYRVFAERELTSTEAAAGGAIRAFGDGQTFDLNSDTDLELRLYADRAGDLVIGEIGAVLPPPWETGGGGYRDGMFVEIYNNSNEILHLDGLVIGVAYNNYQDYTHTSCSVSQPIRVDPTGLYSFRALRFPGSGAEYPIAPGEAKVVAQSAIDHRPVHPLLLDLRGADFEIGPEEGGNVDNPAVPNMQDVGLYPWTAGILIPNGEMYFLAESVPDFKDLPIAMRGTNGQAHVKIPTESVLEAAGFYALWPDQDLRAPPCIPYAAKVFERYEGGLYEIGEGVTSPGESLQRLFLRTEGGRRVLRNTNTSAVDFAFAPQSPGDVP